MLTSLKSCIPMTLKMNYTSFKDSNEVWFGGLCFYINEFNSQWFLWNFQMFHLLIYWYKDLGKWLLIGSFLFQTSLIVCETKPFIIKIHGNPYIDDCEALDLKKPLNYILIWKYIDVFWTCFWPLKLYN